jgi:hypothetical protein
LCHYHYWPTTHTRMLSHNINFIADNKKEASSLFLIPPQSMPTSGNPEMGCRRSGQWGHPTLFFIMKTHKTSKQLISRLPLAPATPPCQHRLTGRVWEHAHIRKVGYGPLSQWPVGPLQAVDEESTRQTRTPICRWLLMVHLLYCRINDGRQPDGPGHW